MALSVVRTAQAAAITAVPMDHTEVPTGRTAAAMVQVVPASTTRTARAAAPMVRTVVAITVAASSSEFDTAAVRTADPTVPTAVPAGAATVVPSVAGRMDRAEDTDTDPMWPLRHE